MNNNDLRLILNTNVSLVVLETHDEMRAVDVLKSMFQVENLPVWQWTATEGLQTLGFGLTVLDNERKAKPEEVLEHIKKCSQSSAFVLCDFHPYLDDSPKIVRHLKDIALRSKISGHKVVLLSHEFKLPPELARLAATVKLALPDENEILAIIREEARSWAKKNNKSKISTIDITLRKLVNNLLGLSHQDVRRLAQTAIADDGVISESDLPEITKAKFELMEMDSILHFEYSTAHLKDVGGLNKLKSWLEDRRKIVLSDQELKIDDLPKGVLLFGVQGGGKSLAAKAIAGVWGLPLLRLDMAALFNKYIGETEKNLREALSLADLMSPCVLWIDEIEKGMANDNSDNATGKRLLGTLLTWMAERKSRVFLVATSNDISVLPPELMRKGRFDEIFFVDLPDLETRSIIFSIHLRKRELDQNKFALGELSELSDGFTGAEIEQAIVSAIYAAHARDEEVCNDHIVSAIQQTQPLSVIMVEQMTMLRMWAKERAVSAN